MRQAALLLLAASVAAPACTRYATHVEADQAALGRVVVYRNGIAYYERRARVEGQSLTLSVPNDKVNDFLKSLTVTDASTGRPLPIAYPTQGATRGSEVDMTVTVPAGIEEVTVTYITEAPAWKPSYRVVMDEKGRVDLQGWAIVDNASGEDWNAVRVGVGSSSAMSFRYDLRTVRTVFREELRDQQRFAAAPPTGGATHDDKRGAKVLAQLGDAEIPRPDGHPEGLDTVALAQPTEELAGSLRGPAPASRTRLGGGRGGRTSAKSRAVEPKDDARLAKAREAQQQAVQEAERRRDAELARLRTLADQLKQSGESVRIEGFAGAGEPEPTDRALDRANTLRNQLILLGVPPGQVRAVGRGAVPGNGPGVQLVQEGAPDDGDATARLDAPGDPVGESHFESGTPMSIARGTSAMVSILKAPAEGEVVYLYDPETDRGSDRYAFRAVRFVNPTRSTLEGGPVTVYGEGRFVGEGLTRPIPPGSTAVVPFALDRQIVVEREGGTRDRISRLVKLNRGALTAEVEHVRRTDLKVTNRSTEAARVFVRHTVEKGWTLAKAPKVHERLGRAHLFEVPVPAGETRTVAIEEATPLTRTLDLRSPVGLDLVRVYVQDPPEGAAFAEQLARVLAVYEEMVRHGEAIDGLREQMAEFRLREAELHGQIATLRLTRAGNKLLRHLEAKMRDVSDRLQEATVRVVEHQEKQMLARIRFHDALSELTLERPAPKATAAGPAA